MVERPFTPAEPVGWTGLEDVESTLPLTPRWRGVRRFVTNTAGLLGSVLLLVLVAAGMASPTLAPLLRGHTTLLQTLLASRDPWGNFRPTLADTISAILPTFTVGLCSAIVTTLLGLGIGGLAGYLGGWVDALLSRLIDFASALPFLPFAIAVIAATGSVQGIVGLIIIFSLLGWVGTARLVRAQMLTLREQAFTEAAQAAGIGNPRILVRHLFPNVYPAVLVSSVLSVASFILAEATLDFLRIGVAHTVTLGSLLANYDAEAQVLDGQSLPQVLVPGAILWLLVLSLHLISEGMQHAFDIREVK